MYTAAPQTIFSAMKAVESAQLVFVPLIGFRQIGTRTLRERTETTANGTKLMVLAVAAAPDRTDVVIEWIVTGDPAICPPDSQLLVHSNMAPLEKGLTAALALGASRLNALTMRRRAYQLSHGSIGAVDALTFPSLDDADAAELHVTEGERDWRVPVGLVPGEANATALAVELARDGIVARATGLARHGEELIVELEVAAPHQIRQVGAPIPGAPMRLSSTSEEDHRARQAEVRRVFGERFRPITLEVDHGMRLEEVGRLFSHDPQQAAPGQPYLSRFVVVFDAPSTETKTAMLVVPFVELNDFEPSVTADLREVPLDLTLGEHRFRVISAEPHGADQRQVVVEVAPSASSPRFTQPARMHGIDEKKFSWNPELRPGNTIAMAATFGDPPIVTFRGAVLRYAGPWRLEIPLP